jgi:hypothetical protein
MEKPMKLQLPEIPAGGFTTTHQALTHCIVQRDMLAEALQRIWFWTSKYDNSNPVTWTDRQINKVAAQAFKNAGYELRGSDWIK